VTPNLIEYKDGFESTFQLHTLDKTYLDQFIEKVGEYDAAYAAARATGSQPPQPPVPYSDYTVDVDFAQPFEKMRLGRGWGLDNHLGSGGQLENPLDFSAQNAIAHKLENLINGTESASVSSVSLTHSEHGDSGEGEGPISGSFAGSRLWADHVERRPLPVLPDSRLKLNLESKHDDERGYWVLSNYSDKHPETWPEYPGPALVVAKLGQSVTATPEGEDELDTQLTMDWLPADTDAQWTTDPLLAALLCFEHEVDMRRATRLLQAIVSDARGSAEGSKPSQLNGLMASTSSCFGFKDTLEASSCWLESEDEDDSALRDRVTRLGTTTYAPSPFTPPLKSAHAATTNQDEVLDSLAIFEPNFVRRHLHQYAQPSSELESRDLCGSSDDGDDSEEEFERIHAWRERLSRRARAAGPLRLKLRLLSGVRGWGEIDHELVKDAVSVIGRIGKHRERPVFLRSGLVAIMPSESDVAAAYKENALSAGVGTHLVHKAAAKQASRMQKTSRKIKVSLICDSDQVAKTNNQDAPEPAEEWLIPKLDDELQDDDGLSSRFRTVHGVPYGTLAASESDALEKGPKQYQVRQGIMLSVSQSLPALYKLARVRNAANPQTLASQAPETPVNQLQQQQQLNQLSSKSAQHLGRSQHQSDQPVVQAQRDSRQPSQERLEQSSSSGDEASYQGDAAPPSPVSVATYTISNSTVSSAPKQDVMIHQVQAQQHGEGSHVPHAVPHPTIKNIRFQQVQSRRHQ